MLADVEDRGNRPTRTARALRSNSTEAERRLWRHLKTRQVVGFKFRRQHPIGPYVADFCCLEKRLIVELDGGQHVRQVRKDQQRTEWLEAAGYRVVRFWNRQIFEDIDSVVREIEAHLTGHRE